MYKSPFREIKLTENMSLQLLHIPNKHIRQWLLSIKEGWKEKLIELYPKDYLYEAPKVEIKGKSRGKNKNRPYERALTYVWHSMFRRCYNPRNLLEQLHYQHKGIRICKEWFDFDNFYNWAITNGYKEDKSNAGVNKLSIDRINTYGNYEPSNCRWASWTEQALNKGKRICNFHIQDLEKYPPLEELMFGLKK